MAGLDLVTHVMCWPSLVSLFTDFVQMCMTQISCMLPGSCKVTGRTCWPLAFEVIEQLTNKVKLKLRPLKSNISTASCNLPEVLFSQDFLSGDLYPSKFWLCLLKYSAKICRTVISAVHQVKAVGKTDNKLNFLITFLDKENRLSTFLWPFTKDVAYLEVVTAYT